MKYCGEGSDRAVALGFSANLGFDLAKKAGPSLLMYNVDVTRSNLSNYNYSGNFNTYMLDARAGLEIPILVFSRLYAEAEIQPIIASDFKSDNVNYTPNVGSLMAARIGVKYI